MDAEAYQDLLEKHAKPAIKQLYPSQTGRSGRRDFSEVVFQDDGATIHRSKASKSKVRELFCKRIEPDSQPAKMDDIWPSEWPGALLEEKLKGKDIKTLIGLKREIRRIWRDVDPANCKSIVRQVPTRFKQVIKSKGRHVLSRRGQSRKF